MTTTRMLETAGADIAYDVRGPLPTADGRPPLFMIGQPMDANGFATFASRFPDRTVVTYDPRGLGRSVRRDGRIDHAPTVQAADVHAALALVAAYPDDVATLVAHEPPRSCLSAPDGGGDGAEERLVMGKVVLDVSMSLDGFTAGPHPRGRADGDGGGRLHAWMAGKGARRLDRRRVPPGSRSDRWSCGVFPRPPRPPTEEAR